MTTNLVDILLAPEPVKPRVKVTLTNDSAVATAALVSLPVIYWLVNLGAFDAIIPAELLDPTTSVLAALTSAAVIAIINRFHPTNNYLAAYAAYGLVGFNPIGLFAGYMCSLAMNSARANVLAHTAIVITAAALLLPTIPLPAFPLMPLVLLPFTIPFLEIKIKRGTYDKVITRSVELVSPEVYIQRVKRTGVKVLGLTALLSLSPMVTNNQVGVLGMIFAFAALGANTSESVSLGFPENQPTIAELSDKEYEEKVQKEFNPNPQAHPVWLWLGATLTAFVGVGIGAGSTAKRFGACNHTSHLLEMVMEGYVLGSLLRLGELRPQRSPISDILYNLDSGYVNQAGESLIPLAPAIIALTLAISVVLCLYFSAQAINCKPIIPNSDTFARERGLAVVSLAVVCKFMFLPAILTLGCAWVAKRYLSDVMDWSYGMMSVLGYRG